MTLATMFRSGQVGSDRATQTWPMTLTGQHQGHGHDPGTFVRTSIDLVRLSFDRPSGGRPGYPAGWRDEFEVEGMMGRRPRLGYLESAVLGVVMAAHEPLTVSQVQAELTGDPAYTTVMSTLVRLAEKGALRRTMHGRAYRYEPAAPAGLIQDALSARKMRRLLDDGDRAAVLARFVAELDADEEKMLLDLLARSQQTTHEANDDDKSKETS